MKKFLNALLLAALVLPCTVTGQSRLGLNINFPYDTISLRRYTFQKDADTTVKTVIINTKFDGADILNPKDLDVLNRGLTKILSIDYVFTEDTNIVRQEMLNKKRILELSLLSPNTVNSKMTKWRYVRQLGFFTDKEARRLFHGFVIRYIQAEPYDGGNPKKIKNDILTRMKRAVDSTVAKIFNRNTQLNKDVIVADFTCSMSPYYLEVLAWLCLNESGKDHSFSFFNDGDGIANEQKIIGRTGGVHQFVSGSLDTMVSYVRETVKFGCSGDEPENDLEAVLKAIEKNPKCKEVILLADNWSDMRDYNLRYQITKPVRIILCGTQHGINPQYLNLAYITKGSVHTIEEDLDRLFELKEGSVFHLAGQTFKVINGMIVPFAQT